MKKLNADPNLRSLAVGLRTHLECTKPQPRHVLFENWKTFWIQLCRKSSLDNAKLFRLQKAMNFRFHWLFASWLSGFFIDLAFPPISPRYWNSFGDYGGSRVENENFNAPRAKFERSARTRRTAKSFHCFTSLAVPSGLRWWNDLINPFPAAVARQRQPNDFKF